MPLGVQVAEQRRRCSTQLLERPTFVSEFGEGDFGRLARPWMSQNGRTNALLRIVSFPSLTQQQVCLKVIARVAPQARGANPVCLDRSRAEASCGLPAWSTKTASPIDSVAWPVICCLLVLQLPAAAGWPIPGWQSLCCCPAFGCAVRQPSIPLHDMALGLVRGALDAGLGGAQARVTQREDRLGGPDALDLAASQASMSALCQPMARGANRTELGKSPWAIRR